MKNWKWYEIAWLALFSGIAVAVSALSKESIFNFSVFLTGVLCVVLAAKGNIWTYIFGMYNTFGYAYLAYTNGLFGEMGLNLFFFVPMNIVGYFMWKKHISGQCVEMRKLKITPALAIFAGCAVGIAGFGYLLSLIAGQNTPYIDATTNVLSIVATLLMILRYREQWVLYMALNVFTMLMWTIRLRGGSPKGTIMVVMWSAYLVNSVYGYYTWSVGAAKRMAVVA